MSEEQKTPSRPRQLWNSALKVVKGDSTEQLIEEFTSEMTLVAEGLCDDQGRLRKEVELLRTEQDQTAQRLKSEQEAQETTLLETQRDIDRRLDDITHRLSAIEAKLNAKPPKEKESSKKQQNLISQLTVLVSIIAGAWVLVTILNLFR